MDTNRKQSARAREDNRLEVKKQRAQQPGGGVLMYEDQLTEAQEEEVQVQQILQGSEEIQQSIEMCLKLSLNMTLVVVGGCNRMSH